VIKHETVEITFAFVALGALVAGVGLLFGRAWQPLPQPRRSWRCRVGSSQPAALSHPARGLPNRSDDSPGLSLHRKQVLESTSGMGVSSRRRMQEVT
jgi:hypothetical protein